MQKVLKWLGIGLGMLVGLVITTAVVLYFVGDSKLNKTRQVQPLAIVKAREAGMGA